MIDKNDFKEMLDENAQYDSQRDLLIKKSRDVLKLSKQTIYSIHRNEIGQADEFIEKMKCEVEKLEEYISKHNKLYYQGAYKVAVQEYVEAMLFYGFVKDKKLYTREELGVETDYYLLGVADLTGELMRKAILDSTKENYESVKEIRDAIEELHFELSKFDFRDNEMRRKYDSIKYDLKKIENLILELKLKDKI